MKRSTNKSTWAELASAKTIYLAVDTEYQGGETLTVQFATRIQDEIRVQLNYSPAIPPPPRSCFGKAFVSGFKHKVIVMAPK